MSGEGAVVLADYSAEWPKRFEEERFASAAHVAFRDMLREDPRLAAEHEALERTLVARFARDRGAHTDGKSSFIRCALRSKCPASAS